MIKSAAWLTAAAAVTLMIGCESKPVEKIPTQKPTAITSGAEELVLKHFQWIAAKKDMEDVSGITPTDPEIAYGGAWWFNKHAGECGIPYTQEMIDGFKLQGLVDMGYVGLTPRKTLTDAMAKGEKLSPELAKLSEPKLDIMPTDKKNKDYETINSTHLRPAVNGGLYRLITALPVEVWADVVVVSRAKKAPDNPKVCNLTLGVDGITAPNGTTKELITLGLFETTAGKPLGVSYFYYNEQPKSIVKKFQKLREANK